MAESEELCVHVARTVLEIAAKLELTFIFKASFDKANRSSGGSSRGPGMEQGLKTLEKIKSDFGVPITTDIHLPEQAQFVAKAVDLIQIPAFLCRQSDILEAAAATQRPVNVKKGQFLASWDCKNIVEKLSEFGATGTMLTERGSSFGYSNLVVDMPGLEVMRNLGVPVCFDATHSAQRPGALGTATGGNRDAIPALARAAAAVGIDALFIETHPAPEAALSDAATQWPLAQLESLLVQVLKIHRARTER